jgi:hypothetical protein
MPQLPGRRCSRRCSPQSGGAEPNHPAQSCGRDGAAVSGQRRMVRRPGEPGSGGSRAPEGACPGGQRPGCSVDLPRGLDRVAVNAARVVGQAPHTRGVRNAGSSIHAPSPLSAYGAGLRCGLGVQQAARPWHARGQGFKSHQLHQPQRFLHPPALAGVRDVGLQPVARSTVDLSRPVAWRRRSGSPPIRAGRPGQPTAAGG